MKFPSVARAAVMTAPLKPLEIVEYPLAPAPAGGVLVQVRRCTICRSDLHTWQGRRSGPLPAVLGHEIVGTVADLGEGPRRDARDRPLAIGDRVTWTLHSSCGRCFYCRQASLPMKCLHLRKYGHDACDRPPHFQGGFAEYCVVDAGTSVFKLDESLSDEVAAPANCAVATIVAGWDAAQLQPGEHVLIQGAGALGCYAAAYAAYAGCRTIVVSDVDPRRLELARRFGATHCLDLSQVDGADAICDVKRLTDGFGVDCAMEVAGTPEALELGLASLRKGGRYVEIGCSFPGAHVSLDLSALLWNRLTILGVHNYDVRHLSGALSFLQATCSECPFVELSPTSYSLDEINAAILAAVEGRALRVAVRPR